MSLKNREKIQQRPDTGPEASSEMSRNEAILKEQ